MGDEEEEEEEDLAGYPYTPIHAPIPFYRAANRARGCHRFSMFSQHWPIGALLICYRKFTLTTCATICFHNPNPPCNPHLFSFFPPAPICNYCAGFALLKFVCAMSALPFNGKHFRMLQRCIPSTSSQRRRGRREFRWHILLMMMLLHGK